MAEPQPMRLKSGATIWIEVAEATVAAEGLAPVSRRRVTEEAAEIFGQALGTIEEIAEEIHEALSRMLDKPKQVSVELGVKFTASAGVIIAQGGADANLRLTLSWTNDPSASASRANVG